MGVGHAVSITALCWALLDQRLAGWQSSGATSGLSCREKVIPGEGSTLSSVPDERDTPAGCAQHIKIQSHYPAPTWIE
ncbi:hypothetical protein VZT92_004503 [Zoarces viviparus]|uniref:Secreted protein n=1 Tax=Zoarces viviparus TaxID=48416 RepID=A0AAW1FYH1_ZOAVI